MAGAAENIKRRAAGDIAEITATDWIRGHIHADARLHGIAIPMPGASEEAPPSSSKPETKRAKPARKGA